MALFNYTVEIKENKDWDLYMDWAHPFVDKATLDESLDEGSMKLWMIFRKECFKPFLPVRIKIYEVGGLDNIERLPLEEREQYLVDTVYRVTANCTVEQRCFKHQTGEERYDHIINFIEPTKLLEREICDTMTFTNYLARDYTSNSTIVSPDFTTTNGKQDFVFYGQIRTPYAVGNRIFIGSIYETFSFKGNYKSWVGPSSDINDNTSYLIVSKPEGEELRFGFKDKVNFIVDEVGTYNLEYKLFYVTDLYPVETSAKCSIEATKIINQKPIFSIATTLNRLLSADTTRRDGIEPQKYTLDPVVAEKYAQIQSPEFHITRCTLWEALSQIGDYIHAIPRLIWNEITDRPDIITFDELGDNEEYVLPPGAQIIAYTAAQNIDETCDAIDSTAENLLNTRDKVQGAISEPFSNGYITPRCEEGSVEITNDKAVITTRYPIYRLDKLECYNLNNGETSDLTAYVFETAEYGTLYSYGGTYPYSTAFALKYSQGDNKITNLAYKQEPEKPLFEFMKRPAIQNILEGLQKNCPGNYTDLAFRITYIPMVSLRAVAKKPYVAFGGNTLLYNQSANTVESESYGENLKGAVARLGNREETMTFVVNRYGDLPKIGRLMGGKYIASVAKEYDLNQIKVSVVLVENFNRLAQYLGLYTNYRLFDVSEKQSVERFVNYGENIVIGDERAADADAGITADGVDTFAKVFSQSGGESMQVCAAAAQGGTSTQFLQSCISVGLGNSVAFAWRCADNFSAGSKSVPATTPKRAAQYVAYGDVYGEIQNLKLRLFNRLNGDFGRAEYDNLPEITDIGANLSGALFDYAARPLVIQKDSRENLNVTTQLHFVVNRKSIVIGSQLAQNNPLVTDCDASKAARLYFLPYELNMLNVLFDLRSGYKAAEDISAFVSAQSLQKKIGLGGIVNNTSSSYKSWAFMEEIKDADGNLTGYGKLYIGENCALAPGESANPVCFNFVSNKEV